MRRASPKLPGRVVAHHWRMPPLNVTKLAIGERVQHELLVVDRAEKTQGHGDSFVLLTLGNASGAAVPGVSGDVSGAALTAPGRTSFPRTRELLKTRSGPEMLPGVGFPEHGGEGRRRVRASYDDIQQVGRAHDMGELAIPSVRMKEAGGAGTGDAPEQDVDNPDLMECIERVQRPKPREIAFDDASRQQTVLSPLHIDRWRAPAAPVGVQHFAMPVRPYVSGCAAGVVADPDDLLVRGHGAGDPGTVDVVLPEQVVTDDRPGWVGNGDGAHEREPFVALDV